MLTNKLKIGLFGIGLDAYWKQFEGLKERLEGYLSIVEKKLAAVHPEIVNLRKIVRLMNWKELQKHL